VSIFVGLNVPMISFKNSLFFLVLFASISLVAQQTGGPLFQVTGTVIDQTVNEPLEYASVSFFDDSGNLKFGGITDEAGQYNIAVNTGTYQILFDYISYQRLSKTLLVSRDMEMGIIGLSVDSEQLNEVVVRAETTEVQIRLDKKVYNIGKDLTTSGATVSDALNNVPSVTVDVDGSIALRGNENVRILINGKPSAIAGFGQTDALRQLPAEIIERVEVITSPSARYDAEGTAGILNIILKKEKTLGINGSLQANLNEPMGYGITSNINLRTDRFNLFNTTGYRNSENPGNAEFNNQYFSDFIINPFLKEQRTFDRVRRGINSNLGIEYFLGAQESITATAFIRTGDNSETTKNRAQEFDQAMTLVQTLARDEGQNEDDYNLQFSLNYYNELDTKGQKLTADAQWETDQEKQSSVITEAMTFPELMALPSERITQKEESQRILIQADYVLPFGEEQQFEAGFRWVTNAQTTDYLLEEQTIFGGPYQQNTGLTNVFDFIQTIGALYTQYGSKFGDFSFLTGLRLEHTGLKGNVAGVAGDDPGSVLTDLDFDKTFLGLFPTVNLVYEISEKSNLTLGYNRRINRPRSWYINPFPSRSSETNVFQGNPDLNPAYASAFDLGYLMRWKEVTLTSSVYLQNETDAFERIQEDTGEVTPNGIPIIRTIPINLSTNRRIGFEAGVLYNPAKWLSLNSSFNFFQFTTTGFYNDVDFGAENTSWFTRSSAKITLPAKINWQTNVFYRGPYQSAQTASDGILSFDVALSKDLFAEKGTLSFNVSDLFNSRKRQSLTITDDFESDSVFQWRQRVWTLSYIYRFNQKKNDRDNRKGNGDQDYGDEGFGS
jgi:hypothetical protein